MFARPATAKQAPTPSEDPVANAPIRIGVLGIEPRFALTDVGVDTNVFNTVSDQKRDVTATFSPGAQVWLRTGRGLLSVTAGAGLVYFREFSDQRSIGSNVNGQYEFRFNRFRPWVSAGTLTTRQRPGFEIDLRARHYESDVAGGSDFRLMSKSTATIGFRRHTYEFATNEIFEGRPLRQELNRQLKAIDVSWTQRLTALTTWSTRVSKENEHFTFLAARNTDSFRVTSGFELGRLALVRGTAFVGYRRLTPADGGTVPEFSGITADVDVAYTAPTQTRLRAIVDRDVAYSFNLTTPYYVQTGWTAMITQRIIGRWDAQLSGGRDRLAYRAMTGAERDARVDFIGRFGGGVGYNLADQIRLSFDVNSFYRSSDIRGREYGAIRSGFSLTYGY